MVQVMSNHDDPIIADGEWLDGARGSTLCRACKAMDRSKYPVAVPAVVRYIPRGLHFGLVAQSGVHIFHKRFVDEIAPYLTDYTIGECRDARGPTDFVTCYARDYVVMRGDEDALHPICEVCGSVFSDLGQAPYLLAHNLTDRRVYQDVQGVLILDDEVARSVEWKRFPDRDLRPIGVRETPLDGRRLPGDPDWATFKMEGGH